MRFMERAYGHSRDFFPRFYGHLYQPTPEACSNCYVIEESGRIVSHVGLFPVRVVAAGVRLTLGGIGGVATLPHARGKGYMTRLLRHAIDEMRARGYPASWLGGDRQRYNTFGWEMAGRAYQLTFSRRSLSWHDVVPAAIEEVLPAEARPVIAVYQDRSACHAQRLDLPALLRRQDLRFWLADDGYVIAVGQARDHVKIIELVSASGNEAGLLRAVLDWNFADDVTWEISAWEHGRLARVMPCAVGWRMQEHGMYRINDLTALLTAALPFLTQRAAGLRDASVTLRLHEHDRITETTLSVRDDSVQIHAGQRAARIIELSLIDAARLIFGGPAPAGLDRVPTSIRALFPIPIYVPYVDRV
jgi:GNAT superfamily N-acetyltransferase